MFSKFAGLDAYNAFNVIECLVALARNYQRTVILTIHQPRSNIYALFDKLILLAKGKLIYSGPAQEACIRHFQDLGYECPLGFNIADYLIDLTMHVLREKGLVKSLSGERRPVPDSEHEVFMSPSSSRRSIRSQQEELLYTPKLSGIDTDTLKPGSPNRSPGKSSTLPQQKQQQKPLSPVAENSSLRSFLLTDSNAVNQPPPKSQLENIIDGYLSSAVYQEISQFIEDNSMGIVEEEQNSLLFNPRQWVSNYKANNPRGASFATQIWILSGRNLKNLVRNPSLLKAHYVITFFIALFIGSVFWKLGTNLSGIQNRFGLFTFSCVYFGLICVASVYVSHCFSEKWKRFFESYNFLTS